MAGSDVTGETRFQFDGRDYVAVFDWSAIAAYERATGESIVPFIGEFERYARAVEIGVPNAWRLMPRASALGEFMRAGLSRHHPEVTAETAFAMFGDAEVQRAFGGALVAAMPTAGAMAGERTPAAKAPPRASTGKASSRAGAPRGKALPASGARRRG